MCIFCGLGFKLETMDVVITLCLHTYRVLYAKYHFEKENTCMDCKSTAILYVALLFYCLYYIMSIYIWFRTCVGHNSYFKLGKQWMMNAPVLTHINRVPHISCWRDNGSTDVKMLTLLFPRFV